PPPQGQHLGDQFGLAGASRGQDHELALGAPREEAGDLVSDEAVMGPDAIVEIDPLGQRGRIAHRLQPGGIGDQLSIRQTRKIRHTSNLPECPFYSFIYVLARTDQSGQGAVTTQATLSPASSNTRPTSDWPSTTRRTRPARHRRTSATWCAEPGCPPLRPGPPPRSQRPCRWQPGRIPC